MNDSGDDQLHGCWAVRSSLGPPRRIELGRDAAGRWIVRDPTGCAAGVFKCSRTALRFIRDEIGASATIVLANDLLEFDFAA